MIKKKMDLFDVDKEEVQMFMGRVEEANRLVGPVSGHFWTLSFQIV